MSKNSVEKVKQEQKYKILIRNLRKQQEEKDNEKASNKKKTMDKVVRYGGNNQVDFFEHPTVIQCGDVRTINIYP